MKLMQQSQSALTSITTTSVAKGRALGASAPRMEPDGNAEIFGMKLLPGHRSNAHLIEANLSHPFNFQSLQGSPITPFVCW